MKYHNLKFKISLENCKIIIKDYEYSIFFDAVDQSISIEGVIFDGVYAEDFKDYNYSNLVCLCQNITEGGHPKIPKGKYECVYAISRNDFDDMVKKRLIKIYDRENKLKRILNEI